MSEILHVRWTIYSHEAPQPLLHCRRCGDTKTFRSADKVRVNANGKRIDAWLIYRCTACDGTWNRPILERRLVNSIDPEYLAALTANDAALVKSIASDADDLKRHAPLFSGGVGAGVMKEQLSQSAAQPCALRIVLAVPRTVSLRLDRLLAEELKLSRNRIHALAEEKVLLVGGANTARALRKPPRDGAEVEIRLPVPGADWLARRACGQSGA